VRCERHAFARKNGGVMCWLSGIRARTSQVSDTRAESEVALGFFLCVCVGVGSVESGRRANGLAVPVPQNPGAGR
jgi:hypothetical protein